MKKNLFRLFNLLMAVIVLLSSTGFGLVEHSCIVKGKQTSLHKSDASCCGKKNPQTPNQNKTTLKKANCCSEEEKYENVDYSSSVSQIVAKFTQKTIDWVKNTVISFVQVIIETILGIVSSSAQSTSVCFPSGRAILVFVQSFLI